MTTVDQLDPTPLHEQLAAIIRGQIRSGELEPRKKLPSLTQLSSRHEISGVMVRRALKLLNEEGWVVTVPARGSFVAPREQWPAQPD